MDKKLASLDKWENAGELPLGMFDFIRAPIPVGPTSGFVSIAGMPCDVLVEDVTVPIETTLLKVVNLVSAIRVKPLSDKFYYPVWWVSYTIVERDGDRALLYFRFRKPGDTLKSESSSLIDFVKAKFVFEHPRDILNLMDAAVSLVYAGKSPQAWPVRFVPGMYSNMRIVHRHNRPPLLSLEGMWPSILFDPANRGPIPLSEVAVSFVQEFSTVSVEPVSDRQKQYRLNFELSGSGKAFNLTVVFKDDLLVERLMFGQPKYFHMMIGKPDVGKKISWTDQARRIRYRTFLTQFEDVILEDWQFDDWLSLAMMFSKRLLRDDAYMLLAALGWMDKHEKTFFDGCKPYPVLRFALGELLFENPERYFKPSVKK